MWDNLCMEYPLKEIHIYSEQLNLRIEPELKEAIKDAKKSSKVDVLEAIRIKIRELVEELKAS